MDRSTVLLVACLVAIPLPITFAQCELRLSASNASAGDIFGKEVALSGPLAVVGSPFSDSPQNLSGSASVIRYGANGWEQEQTLVANQTSLFGWTVCVQDDSIVVGAVGEENNLGAAYVFRRVNGTWVEEARLISSSPVQNNRFGECVALDGDRIVVGEPFADNLGVNSGVAHVFRYESGETSPWVSEDLLLASDGSAGDNFGSTVAISGGVLVVGAQSKTVDGLSAAGAAYVFRRSGNTWTQEQTLVADDPEFNAAFGVDVAIAGNVILVGASLNDGVGINAGAAYVFRFDGATWLQEQRLTALDAEAADEFGVSVSIEEDRAVVGSWRDDDVAFDSGSAYVFERSGGTWSQTLKLVPASAGADDRFGRSVSLSQSLALIGSPQSNDPEPDAGAAFLIGVTAEDCDNNGQVDACESLDGTITDENRNLIPDDCDTAFVRGDVNADGLLDIADGITILDVLFAKATVPCLQAVDSNGDERIDVADAIYVTSALFRAGPLPPAPHPQCGVAISSFSCDQYAACP